MTGNGFIGFQNHLDGDVKMAAHCRSPLPFMLWTSVCLCSFVSVLSLRVPSGPAEPHRPLEGRAADPPGKDAPVAAAAGASQPRRLTGWKLAEEEACRDDLTRICPKHTWTNNLAVLECLQDRKEVGSPRLDWQSSCRRMVIFFWVCRPRISIGPSSNLSPGQWPLKLQDVRNLNTGFNVLGESTKVSKCIWKLFKDLLLNYLLTFCC